MAVDEILITCVVAFIFFQDANFSIKEGWYAEMDLDFAAGRTVRLCRT